MRHGDSVARVPVQSLPLPGGLEQPLLVGLAVHGHEFVREFGEHAHRHGPAAEVGARAPLCGNGTADEQRTVVEFGPRLLGPHGGRVAGGHRDPSFDDSSFGADPHQGRVGAPAEQQPQAGDDHGLARAGLTRHRGETG